MIEFEIKSKIQLIGKRKGQTVYFAQATAQQHLTSNMVIDRIVRETSLSAGDVSNALISLGAIVRDALLMGASVDLADLGSFRVMVTSKMIENEIDVCAEVHSRDVVTMPHGYHGPSVAAPGYDLYYLNVMAGPAEDSTWLMTDDPAYTWIRDTWASQDVDPRLPMTPLN